MSESNIAIVGIAALILGALIGVLVAPEYISLEETERNSFQDQLEAKDLVLANSLEDWEQYAEDVKQYEVNACTNEKRRMTDRLASKNEELINLNKDMEEKWQQIFEDLNETIFRGHEDINASIADTYGC